MAFGNATKGYVKKHSGGGGGGGTTNYSELSNKPTINGVTLDGNKTSEDLHITGGGVTWNNGSISNNTLTIPKTSNLLSIYYKASDGGYVSGNIMIGGNSLNGSVTSGTSLRIVYVNYHAQIAVGVISVSSDENNYKVSSNDITFLDCKYI